MRDREEEQGGNDEAKREMKRNRGKIKAKRKGKTIKGRKERQKPKKKKFQVPMKGEQAEIRAV